MKTLYTLLLLTFGVTFLHAQENSVDLERNQSVYIDCGNDPSLNITGNTITLEAWIRPEAFLTNVWQANIINKSGAGDNGYMIRCGNNGQLNFNIGNGSWNEINSATGVLTTLTWAHVAASYDGTTMRLYVNGAEVANGPLTGNIGSASANLFLGDDPTWTGRYYDGRVEEVKIWNTARTPSQILGDMSTRPCTPYPAGLVAYYRFNAGIANGDNTTPPLTTITDEIGVNHGTMINSSLSGGNSNWTHGRPLDALPDPSFTLTADNCNSASATITGDGGGTFAFNPAPGDLAVIDVNTGQITNGTPGATYFVEYDAGCSQTSIESVTLPSTGNSAFSNNVQCGGATSTITGDIGGTFTFNPMPGDGAMLSSINGLLTNATAGTTYTIEYTVCGSTTSNDVTVLDDNCWTLNGDAQYINVNGEQCIQLTDEVNDQTGCAWNGSQIDFASNFSLTLDYYFGNNIGGADGNTFTFQPSNSTACGAAGAQLGAGGMSNTLAIEFDTYDNDGGTGDDLACDHIAIEIDGDHPDDPFNFPSNQAPLCGPVCAKASAGNIDDGGTYQVDIVWDAGTNTLEVYFDGALRLSCVNDFVTTTFGGNSQVYWGATSATGGLNNQQYFCPSSIVILPIELASFNSVCSDSGEEFQWTTISESRVDFFQLEFTYDGLVFYPIGTMKAIGESQTEQNYSLTVEEEDNRMRYYRLKSVDLDGAYEYTDIISSKRCHIESELIKTVTYTEAQLSISTGTEVEMVLINQLGQVIRKNKSSNQLTTFITEDLTPGMYFIVANNNEGIQESKKIYIR